MRHIYALIFFSFFQVSSYATVLHFRPSWGSPVLVDDFNEDGKIDMVASLGLQQRFYVYSGLANGRSAGPSICYHPAMHSQQIFAMDLTGDGEKTYVVLQGDWLFLFPIDEHASCSSARLLHLEGFDASDIIVGDFEGTGRRQILVVDSYNGRGRRLQSPSRELLSFDQKEKDFSFGFSQVGKILVVRSVDSNKDQILALDSIKGTLHVFEYQGTHFVEVFKMAVGAYPFAMTTVDMNGEIKLAVALRAPNSLRFFVQNGKNEWKADGPVLPLSAVPVSIEARNINGAQQMAVFVAEDFVPQVQVFFEKNSRWSLRTTVPLSGSPRSFRVFDFNQDGKLDLVVANPLGVDLIRGKGDGSF